MTLIIFTFRQTSSLWSKLKHTLHKKFLFSEESIVVMNIFNKTRDFCKILLENTNVMISMDFKWSPVTKKCLDLTILTNFNITYWCTVQSNLTKRWFLSSNNWDFFKMEIITFYAIDDKHTISMFRFKANILKSWSPKLLWHNSNVKDQSIHSSNYFFILCIETLWKTNILNSQFTELKNIAVKCVGQIRLRLKSKSRSRLW